MLRSGCLSLTRGSFKEATHALKSLGRPKNRKYSDETVYYGTIKKSRSLLDLFSKKSSPLDPAFVSILRCPISNKPLRYDAQEEELIQDEEGIVYHVVDGIPILTPSAAKSLHTFVEPETPQ